MKLARKLLCLLLALAMVMTLTPAVARAEEAAPQTDVVREDLPVQINPLYKGLIDEADLKFPESPMVDTNAVHPNATYTTVEKGGEAVRQNMRDWKGTFVVYVKTPSMDLQAICDEMVEIALEHTGKATEGDYILWQYGGWKASSVRSWDNYNKTYNYEITFTVSYYTTPEQEKEMDTAVTSLINSLGVKSKSDYEKVKGVYDWICDNITYDYDNLEDESYMLKHTAYAALIDRTAVCQGYAVLFYRLMLELGVDNRVIAGIGNGGAHGWNIVQLGDYYYSVDSTWDAGMDEYSFFLTSTWNFLDHYRFLEYETWEFHEEYPMAAEDYDPDVTAEIDPYIYIDYCGETAAFSLERDGTVTIVGEGSTYDFYPSDSIEHDGAPWQYWGEHVNKLVVEEGITRLGDAACFKLPNLQTLVLPDTLTTIGERVFDNCPALTTVELPEGLTKLERGAFNYSGIENLTLPNTLTHIYDEAFRGCEKLKAVTIPESVTYIGTYAFSGCDSLTSIVIPANVTAMGTDCFAFCENLEKAELYCPTIPSSLFLTCDKLSQVTLHGTVTKISNFGLRGMKALKEIVIPASVTYIGYGVFNENDIMDTVYFRGNAPEFDSSAFQGSVLTAYYPKTNSSWDRDVKKNYGGTITWEPYTIECTEHTYSSVVTDPTCEEQGYTTHICANCGDSYVDDYVDALGHDLVSTVTEPTCYSEGWTMHQCSRCDYAFADSYVDKVDHSYEGGNCKWCGKAEAYVKWSTISTSLGGNIAMNFYVELSQDLVTDPDAYIQFTFAGRTLKVALSEGKPSDKNGVTVYQFSCPITSKNMTDEITAQVYNASGAVGEPKSMSVDTYCNWVIANFKDEKTVNLMKGMLNYGASAQKLFNYRTDDLANATLAEEDKVFGAVDASAYKHSVVGTEEGIITKSMTLLLDSETTVRVYFELTGDKPIEEYTFTVDGVEVEPKFKDGKYYIERPNISAHRLDDMHVFTCGGITVTYGGLSYVNQVMTYYTEGATFEMASALYAYSRAAEAYIG